MERDVAIGLEVPIKMIPQLLSQLLFDICSDMLISRVRNPENDDKIKKIKV